MKKIFLFTLVFLISCLGVALANSDKLSKPEINDDFIKKYRSDPFQWIFPEYYYKAEIIEIDKNNPKGFKRVQFFGLSACVPEKYTFKKTKRNNMLLLQSNKNDDGKFLISKASNMPYGNDTYYKTPQDMFHKLFTLTPDDVFGIEEKYFIHSKGTFFENAKEIKIYSGDRFRAYLKVMKDSVVKKFKYSYELTIFHTNGPFDGHMIVCFPKEDEIVLNNFISTLY